MRLINARFGNEQQFFWDERANTLEQQTTQPIQDHAEMGFSGANGDPDLDSLIRKMEDQSYYQDLFTFVYGDAQITEVRMQNALAQFVRSIQSFDSKYDAGRAAVNNNNAPFPNFTQQENAGKALFMTPPQFNNQGARIGGGIGCQGCHGAPEFDIVPNSGNNGFTGVLGGGPGQQDLTNERSPSLRDLFNTAGALNSPLMHVGVPFNTVVNHYNLIPGNNPNLDNRLRPGGNPQRLNLTNAERGELEAFVKTLSGTNVYTDLKWSDPFDTNGDIVITGVPNPPTAFVLAEVRVMLEGPFNSGNNLMNDALRAQNLIPIAEPYSALGYTPVNHPGGEAIVDLSVLNVTGPRAIVDWVFVQLLDKNDVNNVLATRSGLIRRDGHVVDVNGLDPLQFDNVGPDDYYVSVQHRNHLRVHTTNTINLDAVNATVIGFVNPQNQIVPPGAMSVINNRRALWAGDASSDNTVNSVDRSQIWNARNIQGYSQEDLELDGSCQASDRSISWNNRNKIGM